MYVIKQLNELSLNKIHRAWLSHPLIRKYIRRLSIIVILVWRSSLSMILNIFLFFDDFEPGDSYKKYSYKKNGVFLTSCRFFSHFPPVPPSKIALNCISGWKLSFRTVKYISRWIFLEIAKKIERHLSLDILINFILIKKKVCTAMTVIT